LSRSRTETSRVRLRGGSPGARNETQVEDPSTMAREVKFSDRHMTI